MPTGQCYMQNCNPRFEYESLKTLYDHMVMAHGYTAHVHQDRSQKWASCADQALHFFRKDHLKQHLRQKHGLSACTLDLLPLDEWVDRAEPSASQDDQTGQLVSLPQGPPGIIPAGLTNQPCEINPNPEYKTSHEILGIYKAAHMADTTRRRYAGVSARFRARQKEKEREAEQKVADLEEMLRKVVEKRDTYASELSSCKKLPA
ncbi:MAG: hypothetical protein Q9227_006679 [Pyrenula ochraceoflavens]